jgi:hypothetical protein
MEHIFVIGIFNRARMEKAAVEATGKGKQMEESGKEPKLEEWLRRWKQLGEEERFLGS